jgi:hypothetical protein
MRQTIAQMLEERGRNAGERTAQRTLLLEAIRIRFGEPSTDVIATVEACTDVSQLDAWFHRVLTARRVAEAGIKPQS